MQTSSSPPPPQASNTSAQQPHLHPQAHAKKTKPFPALNHTLQSQPSLRPRTQKNKPFPPLNDTIITELSTLSLSLSCSSSSSPIKNPVPSLYNKLPSSELIRPSNYFKVHERDGPGIPPVTIPVAPSRSISFVRAPPSSSLSSVGYISSSAAPPSSSSYVALSECVIHTSSDVFIRDFFKFKVVHSPVREVISRNTTGPNEFDVIVADASGMPVRFVVLDDDSDDNDESLKFGNEEGRKTIVFYHLDYEYTSTTPTTAAATTPNPIFTIGYITIAPLQHNQSALKISIETNIPNRISKNLKRLERILDANVNITSTAHKLYYRGSEIDEIYANEFISSMDTADELTSKEQYFLAKALEMTAGDYRLVQSSKKATAITGADETTRYIKLNTPGPGATHSDDSRGGSGANHTHKWSVTVHTSAVKSLANTVNWTNNQIMLQNKIHNNDLPREQTFIKNSRRSTIKNVLNFPGSQYASGMNNRVVENVLIWDKMENFEGRGNVAFVLGFVPLAAFNNQRLLPGSGDGNKVGGRSSMFAPISSGISTIINSKAGTLVQSTTKGVMIFEVIAPNISQVTYHQNSNFHAFGGHIHSSVIDKISAYTLSIVPWLQMKFGRGRREVDYEKFECIAQRLESDDVDVDGLNEEQKEVVEGGRKLERDYLNSTIVATKIPSPSFFVSMELKVITATNKKEKSITTGSASSSIDASAFIAGAYLFDFCSNERMDTSRQEGFPARLEVSRRSYNDATFAVLSHLPWPLNSREYVIRMVMTKSESGVVLVAGTPSNEIVDYGLVKTKNITRGLAWSLFTITPISNNQCRVLLTYKLDAGGFIPLSIIKRRFPDALMVVCALRETFLREQEIDACERLVLIDNMKHGNKKEESDDESEKIIVRSYDRFVKPNSSSTKLFTVESNFIVDTSVEDIAAYLFDATSRANLEAFHEEEAGEKIGFVNVNSHFRIVKSITNFGKSGGFEVNTNLIWKRMSCGDSGKEYFVVVREPVDLSDFKSQPQQLSRKHMSQVLPLGQVMPLGLAKSTSTSTSTNTSARTSTSTNTNTNTSTNTGTSTSTSAKVECKQWSYVRLEVISGNDSAIPITKVKFYSQMNLSNGMDGINTNNYSTEQHTRSATRLQRYFDRSIEVDLNARANFTKAVREQGAGTYTFAEDSLIKTGFAFLNEFEHSKKRSVKSPSGAVTFKAGKSKGQKGHSCRAQLTCRAEMLDVLAYLWDTKARNQNKADTLKKEYFDQTSIHARKEYVLKEVKFGAFSNRDFLGRRVWKENKDDGTIILVSMPCPEDANCPTPSTDAVRASFTNCVVLRSLSSNETSVEYWVNLDIGLAIPAAALRHYSVYQLKRCSKMQEDFQKLRRLDKLDSKDGIAMGEAFFGMKHAKKLARGQTKVRDEGWTRIQVEEMCGSYAALRQFSSDKVWFSALMASVLRNKLSGTGYTVSKKLSNLSPLDARNIGKSLSLLLLQNASPEAAVDEWIHKFPALFEFDATKLWCRPMFNTIAKRLLMESGWGLTLRLYSGAVLSIMDMLTDFVMIFYFFEQGQAFYAYAIITTMSINTTLQLFLVIMVHHKKAFFGMLGWEMIIVILCLRPGLLAWRVASGKVQEKDQVVDSLLEMTAFKLLEVVSEALPAGILQIYALLNSGLQTNIAYLSILVSAACIAFASTSVSYDFDTSPHFRKVSPRFFGYTKISARGRTFVLMFVLGLSQVSMRMAAIALLISVSGLYTFAYLAAGMLIYYCRKALQGDLRYFVNLPGKLSILATVIMRTFTKLYVDFTCSIHHRHPFDIGGAYFTFNIVYGQVVSFFAAFLYLEFSEAADDKKITRDALLNGLFVLFAVWLVSLIGFFLVIDKRYYRTFYDSASGKEHVVREFQCAQTDLERVGIFERHPILYAAIEDNVRNWVFDNYEIWHEEKPDWLKFTIIPTRFIPKKDEAEDSSKRRSGVDEGGGGERGSLRSFRRASFRRASFGTTLTSSEAMVVSTPASASMSKLVLL